MQQNVFLLLLQSRVGVAITERLSSKCNIFACRDSYHQIWSEEYLIPFFYVHQKQTRFNAYKKKNSNICTNNSHRVLRFIVGGYGTLFTKLYMTHSGHKKTSGIYFSLISTQEV